MIKKELLGILRVVMEYVDSSSPFAVFVGERGNYYLVVVDDDISAKSLSGDEYISDLVDGLEDNYYVVMMIDSEIKAEYRALELRSVNSSVREFFSYFG